METKGTLIVNLVDESGSMGAMKRDAEGGYNAFLESQKEVPGDCQVVLYTFSNTHRKVHGPIDIAEAPPLVLRPSGGTALFDSVGSVVAEVMAHLMHLKTRPKVIFVITTDGEENSSQKISSDAVKILIDTCQGAGWEVTYLGTDHDAWTSAKAIGVRKDAVLGFKDYNAAFASAGAAVTRTRTAGAGGQSASLMYTQEERDSNK